MWWKSLVVALLVLPPLAYVAGTLSSRVDAPEQRSALVVDEAPEAPSAAEPRVTLEPRPQPRRPSTPDARAGDDGDEGDEGDDRVTIVRPVPQDTDDDDEDDDDDSDDGDDDDSDDRGDDD